MLSLNRDVINLDLKTKGFNNTDCNIKFSPIIQGQIMYL